MSFWLTFLESALAGAACVFIGLIFGYLAGPPKR
jgi:hypothetical protein